MSTLSGGPNIVTNGLKVMVDVSNINSFPGSGTVLYDLCGNSNVILNGTTTVLSGSVSGSSLTRPFINFEGAGSQNYAYFSDRTTFNVNNSSYEFFTFWRTFDGSPATLFSRETARFYIAANAGGTLNAFIRPSGFPTYNYESNISSANTVVVNTWCHIMFTVDFSGNFVAYRNGVNVGSVNISAFGGGFISPNSNDAVLGSRYNGFNTPGTKMAGGMGLFRFYNRALTAQEVLQNYNAQKSRFNLQ